MEGASYDYGRGSYDSYDSYDGYGRSYDRGGNSRGSYDYRDSYARRGRDGDGDGRYNESRARGYSGHEDKEQLLRKIEEMQRKIDKMN